MRTLSVLWFYIQEQEIAARGLETHPEWNWFAAAGVAAPVTVVGSAAGAALWPNVCQHLRTAAQAFAAAASASARLPMTERTATAAKAAQIDAGSQGFPPLLGKYTLQ